MEPCNESIVKSAFRSFFKSMFSVAGIFIGVLFLCMTLFFFSPPYSSAIKAIPILAEDAMGHSDLLPQTAPVILKINIHGVIGADSMTSDHVRAVISTAKASAFGSRIRGVFLDLNTPGGAASDSDTIYNMIKRFKTENKLPVYAFTEGLCASGGMMVSASADKFFAAPSAIVGSIGVVFGPAFNVWGLMQTHGVDAKTLTQGTNKRLLDTFSPWPANLDVSPYTRILEVSYKRFMDIMISARPALTEEKLRNVIGANIFDPVDALTLGLIDEGASSYSEAIGALAKACGFNDGESYQVVEMQIQSSPLHDLVANLGEITKNLARHPLLKAENEPLTLSYR